MAQVVVEIRGPQGAGKSEVFKSLARGLVRAYPARTVFGFDGEGSRMSADDRKKAAKADILIVTRQTYKRRSKKRRKA